MEMDFFLCIYAVLAQCSVYMFKELTAPTEALNEISSFVTTNKKIR